MQTFFKQESEKDSLKCLIESAVLRHEVNLFDDPFAAKLHVISAD